MSSNCTDGCTGFHQKNCLAMVDQPNFFLNVLELHGWMYRISSMNKDSSSIETFSLVLLFLPDTLPNCRLSIAKTLQILPSACRSSRQTSLLHRLLEESTLHVAAFWSWSLTLQKNFDRMVVFQCLSTSFHWLELDWLTLVWVLAWSLPQASLCWWTDQCLCSLPQVHLCKSTDQCLFPPLPQVSLCQWTDQRLYGFLLTFLWRICWYQSQSEPMKPFDLQTTVQTW